MRTNLSAAFHARVKSESCGGKREIIENAVAAFLGGLAAGLASWAVDMLRERTLKEPYAGKPGAQSSARKDAGKEKPVAPSYSGSAGRTRERDPWDPDDGGGEVADDSREWL